MTLLSVPWAQLPKVSVLVFSSSMDIPCVFDPAAVIVLVNGPTVQAVDGLSFNFAMSVSMETFFSSMDERLEELPQLLIEAISMLISSTARMEPSARLNALQEGAVR